MLYCGGIIRQIPPRADANLQYMATCVRNRPFAQASGIFVAHCQIDYPRQNVSRVETHCFLHPTQFVLALTLVGFVFLTKAPAATALVAIPQDAALSVAGRDWSSRNANRIPCQ